MRARKYVLKWYFLQESEQIKNRFSLRELILLYVRQKWRHSVKTIRKIENIEGNNK